MSEKIKMLELAAIKASNDSGFIAFMIKKYLEFEKISKKELLSILQCSEENYYKLSLCRVPDINAIDFVPRLNIICKYSNSSAIELNKIIKRANSILSLIGDPVEQNTYLIAARDKHNKNEK